MAQMADDNCNKTDEAEKVECLPEDADKWNDEIESGKKKKNTGAWRSMRTSVHNLSRPLLRTNISLSTNPSTWEKAKYAFSCPPHGKFGVLLTWFAFLVLMYGSLLCVTREKALPGGTVFSLYILVIFSQLGGMLVAKINFPPLLGMLLVGILFKSLPVLDVISSGIEPAWSSALRSAALVVILIRAGLGLDLEALRKLSMVVIRLSCLPCLTEAVTVATVAHFCLGFSWKWAFMLGFILAALSPAVVVPCLLSLQEMGWGVEKGIPTLVVAAASIDAVIAFTGFGVCLGLTFSTGSAAWQGLKGPLELTMGISYGIIVGMILWHLPNRKSKNASIWRCLNLLMAGLLAIFGSKGIKFDGAGAVAVLSVAFVTGIGYKKRPVQEGQVPVTDYFNYLWLLFQPILFGLIGTEIRVLELDTVTISWGVVILVTGLTFRACVSFFCVIGAGLNIKERLFIAIASLPKATIQAAIGSTALDYAREADGDPLNETHHEIIGNKILTLAVLAILLTAPLGAIAIMFTAPKLLKQIHPKNDHVNSPS